ncbi:MAG TPA: hydroxymethylbilane synthase [Thermoanaerobaculia bacterium]|jgi:hydroxymethylbilane synthase|nr:hydroxymethylbilane synthase [Thermoanaerobaculia bacterium]
MTKTIRIGTRGSALALWQANEVARLLPVESEIVIVKTTGDKRQDVPLAAIGGKGLFIKELEEALEDGRIDLAVHSLKDVPSLIPEQFALAAFLERADPRDAWIHPAGLPLSALPPGSVIATSAPRRRAQLLARRPDLRVEPIRGNVDTRLEKVRAGNYDAMVLASAGLARLGRTDAITAFFTIEEMVPAAGQGIVALEILAANERVREAARSINHAPSETAALSERGVLQQFGTRLDCYSSVAVHATVGETLIIRAFLSDYDGTRAIRATHSGPDAVARVAQDLMNQGALELLQ